MISKSFFLLVPLWFSGSVLPRRESGTYLDSISAFLGATKGAGILSTDQLYKPRTDVLKTLHFRLEQAASVLIYAPPASGKTSLLQALVRDVLSQSPREYQPLLLIASRDDAEGQLNRAKAAIDEAKEHFPTLKVLLIIDEAQRLYKGLDEFSRKAGVPICAAASYYSDSPLLDSPTRYERSVTLTDLSLTETECNEMFEHVWGKLHKDSQNKESILNLFKSTSKLSLGEEGKSGPKHHVGIFRFMLFELEEISVLQKTPVTMDRALDIVYGQGLHERPWFRRVFKALAPDSDFRKSAETMHALRSFLFDRNFDVTKLTPRVQTVLVKSTLFTIIGGKLNPSTLLVERLLYSCVLPGSRVQPSYSMTAEGINKFIFDVVATMSGREMPETTTPEYSWAVWFYHRLAELLPPQHTVQVESGVKQGKKKGRMDLYLPTLKTTLEYVANGDLSSLNEHHGRFAPVTVRYSDAQVERICILLGCLMRELGLDNCLPQGRPREQAIAEISSMCERLPHWFLYYTRASHTPIAYSALQGHFCALLTSIANCDAESLNSQIEQLRPLAQFPVASGVCDPALTMSLETFTSNFVRDVQWTSKKRLRDGAYCDKNKIRQYRVINFLGPGGDGQKWQEALQENFRKNNITVVPQPLKRTWNIFYSEEINGQIHDRSLEVRETTRHVVTRARHAQQYLFNGITDVPGARDV